MLENTQNKTLQLNIFMNTKLYILLLPPNHIPSFLWPKKQSLFVIYINHIP